MSHYYLTDPNLKNNKIKLNATIKKTKMQFFSNSGIFSKNHIDLGTTILLENINESYKNKEILDIGTGLGVIGIYIALNNLSSNILMIDINQRAIDLANENIILNNIKNAHAINSNLFENIKDKNFDLIISNPPIRVGKTFCFSLYEQSYQHLNQNGVLYLVVGKKQGALSHFKYLEQIFEKVEIIIKKSGFWLLKCQKISL